MIESSWFSTEIKPDAEKEYVHHHNSLCKVGKRVEKNYHRYGTDNRPLCQRCAVLDSEGR